MMAQQAKSSLCEHQDPIWVPPAPYLGPWKAAEDGPNTLGP